MVDRDGRQERRITLSSPLNVIVSSIGSDVRYEFKSKDISISGMFLKFDDPNRLPFNSSSILEVWIELGDKVIFCNAKVARIVFQKDDLKKLYGAGIGVRIIEMSQKDVDIMNAYLSNYISKQEAKAS